MPASPMSFMYRLSSFRCARFTMSAIASAPSADRLQARHVDRLSQTHQACNATIFLFTNMLLNL